MGNDDSGLQEAVLKLTDTVLHLKVAVEKLASKQEDVDDISPMRVAEEEGWETARDTLQDQTEETLDAWKDELNNLLVFAGLFSAVVTAFTVESYSWLQQDSGDVSNTLLAQISMQLSAFTFGSTFLNSTTPAVPLSNVTASFSPVSYAVSVNTLWILSLTLSLISAFFAITAQQWLRQLRLPPGMPVRMAIQFMALRSDALQAWQVPSIISLLPLLLQVAVIFFLIGLFLLLQALNTAVAVAFGVVTLIGLIAFLATTFIPLLVISCPYKSPVIPTGVILLQSLSYPLALAVSPVILGLKVMLQQLPEFTRIRQRDSATSSDMFYRYSRSGMQLYRSSDRTITLRLMLAVGAFYEFSLVPYIKSFGRHMFVDMSRFWLSREYKYLDSQVDDEHEGSSLVSVLLAAPSRSFSKVLPCLRGFARWYRYFIACNTLERSLRVIVPQQQHVIDDLGQLRPEVKPYVSKWISSRHRRVLWGLLSQQDWTQDRLVERDDIRLMTLFDVLDGTEFVMPQLLIRYLLHVCHNLKIIRHIYPWEVRPACLLLHVIQSSSYVLKEQDVKVVHQYASKVFDRDWPLHPDAIRLLFASGALVLHGYSEDSTARSHRLSTIVLNALSTFLSKQKAPILLERRIQSSYEKPDVVPESMHMGRLILNFCSAATQYSSSHLALGSPARSLSHISAVFRRLCSHSDFEEKREMVEALRLLDAVEGNVDVICFSIGWELLMEGWDQFLVALAVVEEAGCTPDDDILWSAMESFLLAETCFSQSTASDQGHDEDIDQHTDSSTIASRQALVPRTGSFRIVSAMPPPGQRNYDVNQGVVQE